MRCVRAYTCTHVHGVYVASSTNNRLAAIACVEFTKRPKVNRTLLGKGCVSRHGGDAIHGHVTVNVVISASHTGLYSDRNTNVRPVNG